MSNLVKIDWLTVGPFQTNVYVFKCLESQKSVIVDGGGEPKKLHAMATDGAELVEIWQTHGHIDHVAGLADLRALSDAPILMHRADLPLYEGAEAQGRVYGFPCKAPPSVDRFLEDGETLSVGAHQAKVILLPGHSPGSVAFYFEELKTILSGDVLFAGSMGRVDLPLANPRAMRDSLDKLWELPDDVRVLSGHGPETTIGTERRRNPYFAPGSF